MVELRPFWTPLSTPRLSSSTRSRVGVIDVRRINLASG